MNIFSNFFKKEAPLLGLQGSGGGLGFLVGGGSAVQPATGGDINAQPGGDGYVYHLFYQPGSLTAPSDIPNVEILVVGPGGGGSQGNGAAGGGGAGGAVHVTGHTLVAGTYTIDIPDGGAGGPESAPNPSKGTRGQNATMISPTPFNITALGGGGGQSWGGADPQPQNNANGGSGGGCSGMPSNIYGHEQQSHQPYTVATGTVARYGSPGGSDAATSGGNYRGSGGGGAGGAGANGQAAAPHKGGQGGGGRAFPGFAGNNPAFAPMPTDWKTAVGPTGHYAGGGGGGSENGGTATPAPGGQGGGGASGAGPNSVPNETMRGIPGIANTGGGGGAGWWDPGLAARGGNGARGIILVRYQA